MSLSPVPDKSYHASYFCLLPQLSRPASPPGQPPPLRGICWTRENRDPGVASLEVNKTFYAWLYRLGFKNAFPLSSHRSFVLTSDDSEFLIFETMMTRCPIVKTTRETMPLQRLLQPIASIVSRCVGSQNFLFNCLLIKIKSQNLYC